MPILATRGAIAARNYGLFGAIPVAYQISRSLRFRASNSAYLSRTFGTPTSTQKYTESFWFKRGQLGTGQYFGIQVSGANGAGYGMFLDTNNILNVYVYYTGSVWQGQLVTTQVFRDPSAWYHFVLAVDTTQATSSNRIRLYVNGSEITSFSTANYPNQNQTFDRFNQNTYTHYIGQLGSLYYTDGYMAEVNFIDGQQLTPSSFGQTDPTTGVWSPLAYTGTYGNNGFYLKFADNSGATATTIGKDSSGNSNNWTPSGISVTAGTTNDSLVDSPTNYGSDTGAGGEVRGNYCTLNPLDKASNLTLSAGNLNFAPADTAALYSSRATMEIPTTGKWIWEVTNTSSAYFICAGLLNRSAALTGQPSTSCYAVTVGAIAGAPFYSSSTWNTSSGGWSVTNISNGDTLVVAYDVDAGKLWFGRVASGGTTVSWYNTSGTANPATGTDPRASSITAGGWYPAIGAYYTPSGASINYGQRPWSFTNCPSGFQALCTQNLTTPAIANGASYMAATLYTGTGSSQSPANSQSNGGNNALGKTFYPDLVWIKSRSAATDHKWTDSVRGVTKAIVSNSTAAETTDTNGLTAFSSTGFTVGSDTKYNNNTATYVAWQWNAGSGSSSSNTSGTITSTVSANPTAGFSVVTFTMNGTTGATVGHGLGVAPQMIIIKRRDAVIGWVTYHVSVGNGSILLLNATDAATAGNYWNSTSPTSSVFTLGTSASGANVLNSTAVAYCFAAVPGFSAFGSYTGTGSATDGPFVWCGFRPRWVLFKNSTSAGNGWLIYDTSRNTYNVMGASIFPDSAAAENGISLSNENTVDYLSNGFKLRSTNAGNNQSGQTIIYAAFAENPFKYSRAR
jgi:hypothetical protein